MNGFQQRFSKVGTIGMCLAFSVFVNAVLFDFEHQRLPIYTAMVFNTLRLVYPLSACLAFVSFFEARKLVDPTQKNQVRNVGMRWFLMFIQASVLYLFLRILLFVFPTLPTDHRIGVVLVACFGIFQLVGGLYLISVLIFAHKTYPLRSKSNDV